MIKDFDFIRFVWTKVTENNNTVIIFQDGWRKKPIINRKHPKITKSNTKFYIIIAIVNWSEDYLLHVACLSRARKAGLQRGSKDNLKLDFELLFQTESGMLSMYIVQCIIFQYSSSKGLLINYVITAG